MNGLLPLVGIVSCLAVRARTDTASRPRQINPVSVLLPYTRDSLNSHRVNATLQAFGGCYKWRVQRPTVIKIRDLIKEELEELTSRTAEDDDQAPEPTTTTQTWSFPNFSSVPAPGETVQALVGGVGECHNVVVVAQYLSDTAFSTEGNVSAEKSWVFAEDTQTGSGVKCEVYVAAISSIVIETTAKSVTVGGAETLRVRAFDREGNVFTSLEGLRFEWEIQDPRFLTLASLNHDVYRPTFVRRSIYEAGEQSDVVLLKGLTSGRTLVRTRLVEPGYEKLVKPAEVWLDVMEPIVAVPSVIRVPPLAIFRLGAKVLRGKESPSQAALVILPNPGFQFSVADDAEDSAVPVLRVNARDARVDVLAGSGQSHPRFVVVSDRRNQNNTDTATIYIQEPTGLRQHQIPVRHLQNSSQTDLEAMVANQSFPVAITPNTPSSVLSLINSVISPPPKQTVWYLPINVATLITAELMSQDGDSMFVPHNAEFNLTLDVDQDKVAGEKPAKILWTSQNLATFVLLPRSRGAGTVKLELAFVRQDAKRYVPRPEVVSRQRFVVVEPVGLLGMPAMSEPPSKLLTEFASPLPIVLPLHYQAFLTLTGGSGVYRVTSSDTSVCAGTNFADANELKKLELKTFGNAGMALLTVVDEANPANFYQIHCVVAYAKDISYDFPSKKIEIDASRKDLQVPVRARAVLPTHRRPAAWIQTGDPTGWSPEQKEVMANRPVQALDAYTFCQGLDERSLLNFTAPTKGQIVHTSGRQAVTIEPIDAPSSELYTCGRVRVSMPDHPVQTDLVASLGGLNGMVSKTQLEFFAALRVSVPSKVKLDAEFNWRSHRPQISKAVDSLQLTSARIDGSVSLAVGSFLYLEILGGPTGRLHRVQAELAPLNRAILRPDTDSSGRAAENRAFKLTCLAPVAAAEVQFTVVHDWDAPVNLSASLSFGCAVPEKLTIIPNDASQAIRVELLPALNTQPYVPVQVPSGQALSPPRRAENRLFLLCGARHQFKVLAWDKYARPLLAIESFNPNWALYQSVNKRFGEKILTFQSDGATLDLSATCNLQTAHLEFLLGAALTLSGEFETLTTGLTATETGILRKSAQEILAAHKKAFHLSHFLELPNSEQPFFSPLKPPLLILDANWRYKLHALHGSGRARYVVEENFPHAGAPTILSVFHYGEDGIPPTPSNMEGVVTVDLSEVRSGQVENWDQIIIQPKRSGTFSLSQQDASLLGGRVQTYSIRFETVKEVELTLWEPGVPNQTEAALRAEGNQISEIESDTVYHLRVTAFSSSDKKAANTKFCDEALLHLPLDISVDFHQSDDSTRFADLFDALHGEPRKDLFRLGPVSHHTKVRQFTAMRRGKVTINGRLMTPPSLGPLAHTRALNPLLTEPTEKIIEAAPLELLVHKPLSVIPPSGNLVLLPGGQTWELHIEGGVAVNGYRVKSRDPNIIQTLRQNKLSIIKTQQKGIVNLTISVDRGQESLSEASQPKSILYEVEVAYPARAAILMNGKPRRSTDDHLSGLKRHRLTRLLGILTTSSGKQFTESSLVSPSGGGGDPFPVADYTCKFTWTTDNSDVVAFVDDTAQALVGTQNLKKDPTDPVLGFSLHSTSSLLRGFPNLVSRVSGEASLAVSAVGLRPGTAKISFLAECAGRNRWVAQFQRWKESQSVSILVTDEENAVSELENYLPSSAHGDGRIPIVNAINAPFRFSPVVPDYDGFGSAESYFSAGSAHAYMGEPLRLLAEADYLFRVPNWKSGLLEVSILCDGSGNAVTVCKKEDGIQTVLKVPAESGNFSISLNSPASVVFRTGSRVGAESILILRGKSSRQQVLKIPVLLCEPTQIHLVPINLRKRGMVFAESGIEAIRPLVIGDLFNSDLVVVLRDNVGQDILVPPHVPNFLVVSSHSSVARPLNILHEIADGGFTIRLKTEQVGCAALQFSYPSDGIITLKDVLYVCSKGPSGDLLTSGNSPAAQGDRREDRPFSAVWRDLAISLWKLLSYPWLSETKFLSDFKTKTVAQNKVLASVVLGAITIAAWGLKRLVFSSTGNRTGGSKETAHSVRSTYVDGRNWPTDATPADWTEPRYFSAFPSTRRTYASNPSSARRTNSRISR